MKTNAFKIGWRYLIQEPAYSLVVILGLAIGLAASLLLLAFTRYSWQYDAQVPDVDNVYVVKQRYNIDPVAPWFDQVPYVVREAAQNTPGVAAVSGFAPWTPFPVRVGERMRKLSGLPALPGFAHMMGLQASEGDLDAALAQPENLALTEKAATQHFGTPHALGRTLQTSGKTLRVAAILHNPPANTTMPFEALIGVNSQLIDNKTRDDMLHGTIGSWGKLLIRVKPGSSLSVITESMQQAIDNSPAIQNMPPEVKQRLGARKVMDIKLSPLRDAYFDREVAQNPITRPGDRGDRAVIAGLAAIAGAILALAAINYVNLATVRVLRRQREIGMRKVLGAGAWQIVLQFLAESLLVALLATAFGLLLAWLALPLFAQLMNRQLDGIFSPFNLTAAVSIGVLLGTICSIYPAWIAIHICPTQVLAGRPDTESARGKRLRQLLTIVQMAVAMGLAGVTFAIAWQTHFAIQASPGFDPAPLLIVDLPENVKNSANARGLMDALLHEPGVTGIAVATDAVGRSRSRWGMDVKREGGAGVFVEMKSVSANFFEQYHIQPVAGRLFDSQIDKEDDPEPIVLNAVAIHALGFSTSEDAIGQLLSYTGSDGKAIYKRIVGIAPELRFFSLHEAQRATAWELWTQGNTLSVRSTIPLIELEQRVQKLWPSYFPSEIPEMHFANDILAANYEDDARLAKLLAIATALALTIAAMGIYALSAHTVQHRTKEIVLRKLYGASKKNIAALVLREIATLILIAASIALPLASIAIARYLSGYVERAPIGYWTLLLALGLAMTTALIAVARQAWMAMRMTPAAAMAL